MLKFPKKSRLLDLNPGYLGSADLMEVWPQEYEVNEKSLKQLGLIKYVSASRDPKSLLRGKGGGKRSWKEGRTGQKCMIFYPLTL